MFFLSAGYLNDLWFYNLATGWWTWVSGSNRMNQLGTFGTRGIAAIENAPGGRHSHSMALDPVNQVIYIFGGYGYGTTLGTGGS